MVEEEEVVVAAASSASTASQALLPMWLQWLLEGEEEEALEGLLRGPGPATEEGGRTTWLSFFGSRSSSRRRRPLRWAPLGLRLRLRLRLLDLLLLLLLLVLQQLQLLLLLLLLLLLQPLQPLGLALALLQLWPLLWLPSLPLWLPLTCRRQVLQAAPL